MIVKARKLPPTQNDSARVRATADNGATLTLPYPHDSLDPLESVVVALAQAMWRNETFSVSHLSGNVWSVATYDKES